jgi:hypothetical protein
MLYGTAFALHDHTKMTHNDILQYRLANHGISDAHEKKAKPRTAQEMLTYMGAMQAQDYAMATWAVGVRLPGTTQQDIEEAIAKGEIIRTHILRPTWHFVSAINIRWMMQLTAPHLKRTSLSQLRQLELDDKVFAKTNSIIEKMLDNGEELTREEIATEISKSGIVCNAMRMVHIMFRAEIDMVVCSGSRRGKQQTYSLFDARVPFSPPIPREEAIARLTQTYFASHGPATVKDFAWWSGLTLKDIKIGLAMVKDSLKSALVEASEYWFQEPLPNLQPESTTAFALPAFDEYGVSYKERSFLLEKERMSRFVTSNGIFNPIIVVRSKVVGIWKREVKKHHLYIIPDYFPGVLENINPAEQNQITSAFQKFADFLNMPLHQ